MFIIWFFYKLISYLNRSTKTHTIKEGFQNLSVRSFGDIDIKKSNENKVIISTLRNEQKKYKIFTAVGSLFVEYTGKKQDYKNRFSRVVIHHKNDINEIEISGAKNNIIKQGKEEYRFVGTSEIKLNGSTDNFHADIISDKRSGGKLNTNK